MLWKYVKGMIEEAVTKEKIVIKKWKIKMKKKSQNKKCSRIKRSVRNKYFKWRSGKLDKEEYVKEKNMEKHMQEK